MPKYKVSYSFESTGEVVVEAENESEADEKAMKIVEFKNGPWTIDVELIEEGEEGEGG